MTARTVAPRARQAHDVEICGWRLDGREDERALDIAGRVTLGGRWPTVEGLRIYDPRAHELIDDIPDAMFDAAEEALIAEARALWGEP